MTRVARVASEKDAKANAGEEAKFGDAPGKAGRICTCQSGQ
jgi:hypothetical protein